MTTIVSPALISDQILHVRDEKSSGTGGGTFTSGSWTPRTLNTAALNTIAGASLGSNQITLPSGTYVVRASAPALSVDQHQLRLQNITDSTTTQVGPNRRSWVNSADSTPAELISVFTIPDTKVFELQHRCTTTRSSDGFGPACSFGTEVYADVFVVKVG